MALELGLGASSPRMVSSVIVKSLWRMMDRPIIGGAASIEGPCRPSNFRALVQALLVQDVFMMYREPGLGMKPTELGSGESSVRSLPI